MTKLHLNLPSYKPPNKYGIFTKRSRVCNVICPLLLFPIHSFLVDLLPQFEKEGEKTAGEMSGICREMRISRAAFTEFTRVVWTYNVLVHCISVRFAIALTCASIPSNVSWSRRPSLCTGVLTRVLEIDDDGDELVWLAKCVMQCG